MSLVKRNIIFPKGTTDGFQLIPQPARAPLGGVAYAEKDDDVVPYDQMVAYVAANTGSGGGSTITYGALNPPTGGANGDYYISSQLGINFWFKSGGIWYLLFGLDSVNIKLDDLGSTQVIQNQTYLLIDGPITALPIGIRDIKVQALSYGTADTPGVLNRNCQAFSNVLDKYVDCEYDIINNKIVLHVTNHKVHLTENDLNNRLHVTSGDNPVLIMEFGTGTYVVPKKVLLAFKPTGYFKNAKSFGLVQDTGSFNQIFYTGGVLYPLQETTTLVIPIFPVSPINGFYDLMDNAKTYAIDFDSGSTSMGTGTADVYIDFDVIFI